MPMRRSPKTLKKCCLFSLARNWDLICYAAHSPREMADLLEDDAYLNFEGPFTDFPSTILEDLMDAIRRTRNLSRKFLHLLLREQLLKLNLSIGVGEVYYGLQFLPRCKRLRELNLAYLRHVEPKYISDVIPYLSTIVTLNLGMTATYDPLLAKIAEHCPNLHELNLTSTFISDEGLMSLCGVNECSGSEKKCDKLQRLMIAETSTTWVGAYQVIKNLPNLTDFDFDKIFQVFEHLDPTSLKDSLRHPALKLRSLYSTAANIRPDSIEGAVALCPKTEILSVMNTWIDNETFYKFMQFENLKTLTLFNSEGKTLDYEEGILPVLLVIGVNLENLILSKFSEVDLVTLGRSCPRLKKMALSGISEYQTSSYVPVEGLYTQLNILELWLDDETDSHDALLQLLHSSVSLESLLIKKSNAFDTELLQGTVWRKNPMRRLSRLTLDQCNGITKEALEEFLSMENELSTIRIWSCNKIKQEDKNQLKNYIQQWNLDVYFEWFE